MSQNFDVSVSDRRPRRAGENQDRLHREVRVVADDEDHAVDVAARKIWGARAMSETSEHGYRMVYIPASGADRTRRIIGQWFDFTVTDARE